MNYGPDSPDSVDSDLADPVELTVDVGSPSDNLNIWRKKGHTVMEYSEKIISRIVELDMQ